MAASTYAELVHSGVYEYALADRESSVSCVRATRKIVRSLTCWCPAALPSSRYRLHHGVWSACLGKLNKTLIEARLVGLRVSRRQAGFTRCTVRRGQDTQACRQVAELINPCVVASISESECRHVHHSRPTLHYITRYVVNISFHNNVTCNTLMLHWGLSLCDWTRWLNVYE